MRDLKRFEELSKQFEEAISAKNVEAQPTTELTTSNVLSDTYKKILKQVKTLNSKYGELLLTKSLIGDTYIQMLCYLLYLFKLQDNIDEYKELSALISELFSKNSKLNRLLAELEKLLVIYTSTNSTDTEKATAKERIKEILKELSEYLKKFFSDLGMLDESSDITLDPETGKVNISSDVQRMFSKNGSDVTDSEFFSFSGYLNRSGFIAQKSHIYVKHPYKDSSSFQKYLYITAPGINLSNVKFENDPKNIIFNLFNIKDYTGIYLDENDGSDEEEKKSFVEKNRAVRFGSLLSPTEIQHNKQSQPISVRLDSGWNFVLGKVYKRKKFKLNKVEIEAKFNDKPKADTIDTLYPKEKKFSDKIIINQYIESENDQLITPYIINGTLDFDQELTDSKNEQILERNSTIASDYNDGRCDKAFYDKYGNQPTGTFYKGTLNLLDENKNSYASNNEAGMVARMSSKDVICQVCYNASNNTYSVKCSINDENNSNLTYINENQDSDIALIPAFFTNFDYDGLTINNNVMIDTPQEEVMSNLLGLASMDMDNFDESMFSSLLNNFLNAKNIIIGTLIQMLKNISSLATGVVTISGLMPQSDETFTKDTTQNIILGFSDVSSQLVNYVNTNQFKQEELYNGVVYNKLIKCSNKLEDEFKKEFDDVIESDNLIYEYCKKLQSFNNEIDMPNTPSLVSAANTLYDILALKSQSLNVLQSSGYGFVKLPIISYAQWKDYLRLIPDGNAKYQRYFIDSYNEILLYVSTQVLRHINGNHIMSDSYKTIQKIIKIILMRLLKDNINSPYYKDAFNPKVYNAIKAYRSLANRYTINCANINSDFINPYICNLFPNLSEFNKYNLDNINYNDLKYIAKPLFYLSILRNTGYSEINENFKKLYRFLTNGQTLNFREVIVLIQLLSVYKEIKDDSDISEYVTSLDNIGEINKKIKDYINVFNILLGYYKTMNNKDEGFIQLLDKSKATSGVHINTVTTVHSNNNGNSEQETTVKTEYHIQLIDLLSTDITEIETTEILNEG